MAIPNFRKIALSGSLGIIAFIGLSASSASAQDNDVGDTRQVEETIIVTGVRGSLARSLDQKRDAVSIIDGISSEDIVDFPDLNVSESLSRVSGVTINRVLGEGQQVGVRGLAAEFTRVTINGQTATSGNSGREVDFDVFASELFSNVQLTKTPSAELTEGGLAASIDLKTARPFDFSSDKPVFATSVQGGHNDRRGEWDPRISALASSTFADGKLGVLASVSWSKTSLRQDNAEGLRFIATDIDHNNDDTVDARGEYPFIPRYVLELYDRDRLGVTGAVQFRPTDTIDLNADIAYARFDTLRRRTSIDGLIFANDFTEGIAAGLPVIDDTGLIVSATLDDVVSRSESIRTREEEDLILFNTDGAWRFASDWEVRAKIGYSEASRTRPEIRSVWQTSGEFSYDLTDRIFPDISQTDSDFANPSDFIANQTRFETFNIGDNEFSIQSDLEYQPDRFFITSVSAGIRYSDRQKSQTEFDGRITVTSDGIVPTEDLTDTFWVNDFFKGRDLPQIVRVWFVPNFDAVLADPRLVPVDYEIPQVHTNSFVIDESTIAGYVQADFDAELGPVSVYGNVGVRVLNTDQISNGYNLVNGSPVAVSIKNNYTQALPSTNIVVEPYENVLLRFATSRSLTRPTLTELQPGGSVAPTGLTASLGNPQLNPFTATQIDISAEWYFASEALVAFTWFFKDVDGFITDITVDRMIDAGVLINDDGHDVSNAVFAVSQPVNGEKAIITGFEISLQTPFSFLPEPFDGFGILANFTFADSSNTILFEGEEVTTNLPGQSRTSFNIIGYYEKGPFSTRLVYSWRDSYLDEVRPQDNQRSNFIDAYGQLDINIQYDVSAHFSLPYLSGLTLTLDMLNLTEEEQFRYAETRDRNIRFSETGRFFLLGIRGSF